jgi:hypothetical protein
MPLDWQLLHKFGHMQPLVDSNLGGPSIQL